MMLSILITSYNRPKALEACLLAIHQLDLKIPFEVVVSDDGSENEQLELIKALEGIDRLLTSETNTGLGANLNRGLKACKGSYILYCQEDFILKKELNPVLIDSLKLLDEGRLDMVRFQANYQFPKLIPILKPIYEIPHFSWRNFKVNTFQYSDNPFVSTPAFFSELDYFIEGVRGDYGETEFAIRVLRKKMKIGITRPYYVAAHKGSVSTIRNTTNSSKSGWKIHLKKWARAVRQHLEWVLYNPNNRRLLTYSK